jgi:serine/threonine protein kinase
MANDFDTVPDGAPEYIGRYRLGERLGRGAMGVVYAAEDEAMGRPVAIKVMLANLEIDPAMRERFYREARLTGQLVHPNIVTVFDLGEEDGRPFLVMERLHGAPLVDLLREPAPGLLDTKIDWMLQTCDGLQAAHERGIVHRDVKPSNLFVQRDGGLKILDFGLALLATSTLTASGLLVGTPQYMSPEQARGSAVDVRSDLFSTAGVFYFMLTGRPPFDETGLSRLLDAIVHQPPAPIADHEAPASLARVVLKSLAKDPDERHQSCAHLRAEIEQVRLVKDGERHRTARAALDRYRQIEALLDERRTLGRGLKVHDIDGECDRSAARLAQQFPQFARLGAAGQLMPPMELEAASAALSELQNLHNAELAAVAVLRAASGRRPDQAATRRHSTVHRRGRAHGGSKKEPQ